MCGEEQAQNVRKWGILGCADIAKKECYGIGVAPNAVVVAVASRTSEKAQAFAQAHAPDAKAYGSYDDLLNDDEVEVVYIPLPTGLRKEWVLKAAAAKKHIVCEKPIAANYKDAAEMVEACQKAGVQFMDNTMFMHHARLPQMHEMVNDPKHGFGKVKHVISTFSIPFGNYPDFAKNNIRMDVATEPLGALGDLGWYTIRLTLWAFNWELPEAISCTYLETTEAGVPLTVQGLMRYSGGRSAAFDCSFKCSFRQSGSIVGENRHVELADFVVDNSLNGSKFEVCQGTVALNTFPRDVATVEVQGRMQHANLVERMSKIVSAGALESSWPEWTLLTQRCLVACHTSGKQGAIVGCPLERHHSL